MEIERPHWLKRADKFVAAFMLTFVLNFLLFPLPYVFAFLVGLPLMQIPEASGVSLLLLIPIYGFGLVFAAWAIVPGLVVAIASFRLIGLIIQRNYRHHVPVSLVFSISAGLSALIGLTVALRMVPLSQPVQPSGISDTFVLVNAACAAVIGYFVGRRTWSDEEANV